MGKRFNTKRYFPLSRESTLFGLEAIAPLALAYEALVLFMLRYEIWHPAVLESADPFAAGFLLSLGLHTLPLIFLLALFLAWTSASLEEKRENEIPRPFFVLAAMFEGALPGVLLALGAYFLAPLIGKSGPAIPTIPIGPLPAIATGFAEQLVFRFFIQSGVALLLREIAGLGGGRGGGPGWNIALPVSALLLAAAHLIGPAAAPFLWPEFLFRLLVPGLLFGYLYRLRGLPFVTYLHTAYCLTWAVLVS